MKKDAISCDYRKHSSQTRNRVCHSIELRSQTQRRWLSENPPLAFTKIYRKFPTRINAKNNIGPFSATLQDSCFDFRKNSAADPKFRVMARQSGVSLTNCLLCETFTAVFDGVLLLMILERGERHKFWFVHRKFILYELGELNDNSDLDTVFGNILSHVPTFYNRSCEIINNENTKQTIKNALLLLLMVLSSSCHGTLDGKKLTFNMVCTHETQSF